MVTKGNKKVCDCVYLDNTPPKCFPTGYEGCKLSGKICIPKAEGIMEKCPYRLEVVEPEPIKSESLLSQTHGEDYV